MNSRTRQATLSWILISFLGLLEGKPSKFFLVETFEPGETSGIPSHPEPIPISTTHMPETIRDTREGLGITPNVEDTTPEPEIIGDTLQGLGITPTVEDISPPVEDISPPADDLSPPEDDISPPAEGDIKKLSEGSDYDIEEENPDGATEKEGE